MKYTDNETLYQTFVEQMTSNEIPTSCDSQLRQQFEQHQKKLETHELLEYVDLHPVNDVQMYMEKSTKQSTESIYYEQFLRVRSYYKGGHLIYKWADYVNLVLTIEEGTITHADWVKSTDWLKTDKFRRINKILLIVFVILGIIGSVCSLIAASGFDVFVLFFVWMFCLLFYLYALILLCLFSLLVLIIAGIYVGVKTLYCGGVRNNRMFYFHKYAEKFTSYDFEKIIFTLLKQELLQNSHHILDTRYDFFYKILQVKTEENTMQVSVKIQTRDTLSTKWIRHKRQSHILNFSIDLDAFQNAGTWKETLQSCTFLSLQK